MLESFEFMFIRDGKHEALSYEMKQQKIFVLFFNFFASFNLLAILTMCIVVEALPFLSACIDVLRDSN